MRISDWSSDVCSSDLARPYVGDPRPDDGGGVAPHRPARAQLGAAVGPYPADHRVRLLSDAPTDRGARRAARAIDALRRGRSEEHTSELQSLMRISYAVFCLKKKNKKTI